MKVFAVAILITILVLTIYAEARGCPAEEFWQVREMRVALWVMLTPVAFFGGMQAIFWLAGVAYFDPKTAHRHK